MKTVEIQVKNLTVFICSTNNPSIDPLSHIIALEGYYEITVVLHIQAMIWESS